MDGVEGQSWFQCERRKTHVKSTCVVNAQVAQYNLVAVVGDKEVEDNTVTLRCRDSAQWRAVEQWLRQRSSPVGENVSAVAEEDVDIKRTFTVSHDEFALLCSALCRP